MGKKGVSCLSKWNISTNDVPTNGGPIYYLLDNKKEFVVGQHEGFIALNIINFAGMTRRENDEVLWDVRRISSS